MIFARRGDAEVAGLTVDQTINHIYSSDSLSQTRYWLGYVMVDFICTRAARAKTENYQNEHSCSQCDSNLQPPNHFATSVTIKLSDLTYHRRFKT